MPGHERIARLGMALAATTLVAAACAQAAPTTAQPQAAVPKASAPAAAPATSPSIKPFIPVGKFSAKPAHAPAGTLVTASATGLAPATSYDLVWLDVEASWKLTDDKVLVKGRQFTEIRKKVAAATTDVSGAFSVPFTVPSGFGFQHDLLVVKGDEVLNKLGFDVDMELTLSPTSGPAGTPITIAVKGIGYRTLQNSWLVSYDNAFTGWLSAVTTKGSAEAVIPATGRPGTHIVTVIHGAYGMPYLNPQDSPQPDRPTWRIPFTVTEGEAVLPPSVVTQTVADTTAKPPDRGTFWSEPNGGVVGSRATLRASGLRPSTEIELVWYNAGGVDAVAGARAETAVPLGKVRTGASGALTWEMAVPDEAGGVHKIVARAGDQVLATTTFAIQPSVQPLPVTRGPSGTQFTIQLNGIYTTDTGKIYHLVYDNAYAGYSCSFNTGGNVKIPFRVSGDVGWHFIDLYPGIYDGEDKLPDNYKMPQLTAVADHPGERMPIFRLAFLITAP